MSQEGYLQEDMNSLTGYLFLDYLFTEFLASRGNRYKLPQDVN